jgi:hypothetical protein
MQRLSDAEAGFATAYLHRACFSERGSFVKIAAPRLDCLTKLPGPAAELRLLDQKRLWGGGERVIDRLWEENQEAGISVVLVEAVFQFGALSKWPSRPVVRRLQKLLPIAALHDHFERTLSCRRMIPEPRATNAGDIAFDSVRQQTRTSS